MVSCVVRCSLPLHGSICEDSSVLRILVVASVDVKMIPEIRLLLAGRADVAGAQMGITCTGSMWIPLNPSGP